MTPTEAEAVIAAASAAYGTGNPAMRAMAIAQVRMAAMVACNDALEEFYEWADELLERDCWGQRTDVPG